MGTEMCASSKKGTGPAATDDSCPLTPFLKGKIDWKKTSFIHQSSPQRRGNLKSGHSKVNSF